MHIFMNRVPPGELANATASVIPCRMTDTIEPVSGSGNSLSRISLIAATARSLFQGRRR